MTESFRELGQIKIAALLGSAVILIGFFIFISMRVAAPMMSPLFTNVPTDEGAKIIQELDKRGIPYELRAGGTQVMVPSDQVNKLRLVMAEQGIPSQGSVIGYEIFDKSDAMGTSNFVLNINQLRALEGELARTINDFESVEQARVHLVMPKRELFTRDTVEPTASVALKLRSSGGLTKSEIAAIRHLVATAVPGLKPQRITIVDSRGGLLAKGVDEKDDANVLTEEAEDFRVAYEKRLGSTVEQLLEQSIGVGKVKAKVHADIDFDRTVRNLEKYDPEGQVARSVQSINENEKSNERSQDQTVSVSNNLPDANAAGGSGSNAESNRARTEETTNFEISKEVINSVKETGNVKRLSVAVLVDGIYTTNAEGEQVYQPRSEEELEKLRQLVNSAIGFEKSRGDEVQVVNMQFAAQTDDIFEEDGLAWLKDDLNNIIQTLVLGGVAILAILLVIRPLVARAIESAEASQRQDELEQAALAAPSIAARLTDQSRIDDGEHEVDPGEEEMINIDRIQGKVKSSTYNKINSMVEKHPEETLQILRQWLMA
ncbi:MAG: flagellar M-ring protein FliF [Alphaproteobacteria bacterium]|nr:flagellar M-ring protein FliF [Alphaproteobacteria bacterium]